jgi:acetylserotonin N-methyltransferase
MLDRLEQPAAVIEGEERVAEMLRGFFVSKVCFTALELGVFEALAESRLDSDSLAEQLYLHPVATQRLCDALQAIGLLERSEDRYTVSCLARRYLVEDSPQYVGDIALLYSWDTYPLYQHLDLAVREGSGWQRHAPQAATFDNVLGQPGRLQKLVSVLHRSSEHAAEALLEGYELGRHDGLVAIGGEAVELCVAAARHHPHLRCTLFEQPHMCAETERQIAESGFARRIRVWPGNLFARFAIPRAGDVIVLGRVLHLWDDGRALEIVRACADALPLGGRLLIHEQLLESQAPGPSFQNLTTFLLTGGRERSAADYVELIEEAGMHAVEIRSLAGACSLVIGER